MLQHLFGCTHQHLSRVWTIQRQSYVVCLDCARSFHYDLRTMRAGPAIDVVALQPDSVTVARNGGTDLWQTVLRCLPFFME